VDAALALCRFTHFLSVMIPWGIGGFAWGFAPPELRRAISPASRRWVRVASIVALLSALLWLALETASMEGEWRFMLDPDAVMDVLTGTEFGRVWQARLALALAFVAAAALTSRENWALPTCLAAVLLGSLGFVDHAAMQEGSVGALHRANDATHLLAAGAWLGGLVPFLMCLRAYEDGAPRADAVTAMMRFSATGHFNVAIVIATGATNVALTTGAVPWPPNSPYRALLSIKIVLVCAMVSLALVNRYVLVPRAAPGAPALRALRRASLAEVATATAIVGLVSVFGLLDPA
jgi:putative copper resistance protein D